MNNHWRSYQEFLASPEWHRLREYVLTIRPWCDQCIEDSWHIYLSEGINVKKTLATEVHHKTYEHGWLCEIKYLRPLCAGCHDRMHYDA